MPSDMKVLRLWAPSHPSDPELSWDPSGLTSGCLCVQGQASLALGPPGRPSSPHPTGTLHRPPRGSSEVPSFSLAWEQERDFDLILSTTNVHVCTCVCVRVCMHETTLSTLPSPKLQTPLGHRLSPSSGF